MKNNMQIKRDPALDIIRCVAFALVVSVHFALNSGFYNLPVKGGRMYIITLIRTGSMTCVPLFMVLNGYLMCNKQLNKDYYFKITKTIAIYLLASIVCIFYKNLYLKESISVFGVVQCILNFSAAPYSWYIEMYIGLFILIPFLNVLYNNLKSDKQKLMLLFTMLFLTSLGGVINIYDWNSLDWWKQPGISNEYHQLIPEWWTGIFPLTYYFLGAYIREYKPEIKKKINLFLLILSVVVFGTFNYWRSYGVCFIWGSWQAWGSLFNVIMTFLLFVFLLNVKWISLPNSFRKGVAILSDCCLGAYLVSWIFDNIFYGILAKAVPEIVKRMDYYIIIVPIVIVCSLFLSYILNKIYEYLCKMCDKILMIALKRRI